MKISLRIILTGTCLIFICSAVGSSDGTSGKADEIGRVEKQQSTADRDTVGWTVYNTSNSGLPSNWVQSIAIDDSDCIWIGTDYCGLVKFDESKNEWSAWNRSNCAIPSNIVEDVEIDSKGNTWVATYGGLARFDGSMWTVWNKSTNEDWPEDYILCMDIDDSGIKWLGTTKGLIELNDSTWICHWGRWYVALAIDGRTKWIGTNYDGLRKFINGTWTDYNTSNSDLPDNNLRCIDIDKKGYIWIGTDDHGLANGFNNCTVYNSNNVNFPSNDIEAVAVDENDHVWIGFGFGGMARYDRNIFTFYTTSNSGLPDGFVECFAFDREGRTWIGTRNGGLAVFDDPTGMEDPNPSYQTMPEQCVLYQNYPNPFNPRTVISYTLKVTSYVDLSIVNIIGQKAATLVSGRQRSGDYEVTWDAEGFPSGVYFCRLSTDQGFTQTRKMVLMR